MFSKSEIYKFLLILGVIVALLVLYFLLNLLRPEANKINSFKDCIMAGNPAMESYPRQCRTQDGRLFVENLDTSAEISDVNDRDIPRDNDRELEDVHLSDDDSVRPTGVYDGCVITGCSGQICSNEEVETDCSYASAYACYRRAVCERQIDKRCGWTQTPELQQCINTSK